MTEQLVISGPENRDESTLAGEAWTQSVVAPIATRGYVLRAESENAYPMDPLQSQRAYRMIDALQAHHVYHVNPPQMQPISPHYIVLTNGVTATGVDYSGAQFICEQLARWTCQAAITAATHRWWVDDEPGALMKRLRHFQGGLLEPALDAPLGPSSPQEMVNWLHEESGLTWDQLARTLGVSRRSAHAWANGQRVSGRNLERLSYVYSAIKSIDASSAEDRRHALFSPQTNNQPNLFDQLVIRARKAVPPRDEQALLRRLGIAPED